MIHFNSWPDHDVSTGFYGMPLCRQPNPKMRLFGEVPRRQHLRSSIMLTHPAVIRWISVGLWFYIMESQWKNVSFLSMGLCMVPPTSNCWDMGPREPCQPRYRTGFVWRTTIKTVLSSKALGESTESMLNILGNMKKWSLRGRKSYSENHLICN